jgi:CelD/BcsL family acetyltransferase involved in cellulose biosynthesis
MYEIKILVRNEYSLWDDYLDGHHPENLFSHSFWIEAISESEGAEPVITACIYEGEIAGGIAGAVSRRMTVQIFEPPLFTPYNGILLRDNSGINKGDETAVNKIYNFIRRRCDRAVIAYYPGVNPVRPTSDYRFDRNERQTLLIDLSDEGTIRRGFKHSVRKQIKKAEREGVTVVERFDPRALLDLQLDVLRKAGIRTGVDREKFCTAMEKLRECGCLKIYLAVKDDDICGAWGIATHGNRAHSWLTGVKSEYYNIGAGHKLTADTMIKLSAEGFTEFDFGGINIPGVRRFKETFGGEPVAFQRDDFVFTLKGRVYRFLQKRFRGG